MVFWKKVSQPDILILLTYGCQIEMTGCDGTFISVACLPINPDLRTGRPQYAQSEDSEQWLEVYLSGPYWLIGVPKGHGPE